MRKLLLGVAAFFLLASFWSCNPMPNGGLPVYIQVDTVSVSTNYGVQGSSAHKISDVWVTVNGKQIGVFEHPVKVPVLASGDLRVQISAGIKDNGVSNTRVQYPFYAENEYILTATQSTQSYVINPVFTYVNGTNFPFMTDFEGSNGFANVSAVTEDAFEGNSCGKISLNTTDTTVLAYSSAFPISSAGLSEVYLEMNYKCTGFFECGILSYSSTGQVTDLYKITFNPREAWNKTYLNFSNDVGRAKGENYRIYFKISKLPSDPNPVYVWLDNIKLVQR